MIGVGVDLMSLATRRRTGGVDFLSAGQWLAREAMVGDSGYSHNALTGGPLRIVTFPTDIGRGFAGGWPAVGTLGARRGMVATGTGYTPPAVGEVYVPAAGREVAFLDEANGDWLFSSVTTPMASPRRLIPVITFDGGTTWLIAAEFKTVTVTPRAETLTAPDWTVEGIALAVGTAGVEALLPGIPDDVDYLAWATTATPVAGDWTEAVSLGGDKWRLTGLSGAPGATLTGIKLIYASPTLKTAATSDAKEIVLPAVPTQFAADGASLVDAPSPLGDRLTLTVSTLPASDLPLTRLEYALDAGAGFDTWVAIEAATGFTTIQTLATTSTTLRLRGFSAIGGGTTRDFGPVTPTVDAEGVTPAFTLSTNRTTLDEGQAVFAEITPATIQPVADAAGLTLLAYQRDCEWRWTFGESYTFDALPAEFRGPRTSGNAYGPFAAHVYRAAGTYSVSCSLYRRGVLVGTATQSVTVSARSFSTANTGVYDPAETWALEGIPAHDVANRFTDIDAAFTWLQGASGDVGRRLSLRRGTTGAMIRNRQIRSNSTVDAYGTGDRPLITPSHAYGSQFAQFKANRATGIATAAQTDIVRNSNVTWSGAGDKTRVLVFVNNLYVDPADYTLETTVTEFDTVRLNAGMTEGHVFYAFPRVNDTLNRLGNNGGGKLFSVSSASNTIIRDIEIRGDYDPANPGGFDGLDLSTYEHDAETGAFSATNTSNNLTFDNMKCSGLAAGFAFIASGDGLIISNCISTSWYDYGVYISGFTRSGIVGCDVRQPIDTINGPGAKATNQVSSLNHADHGPIRGPDSTKQIVNRCFLGSRNDWGADFIGDNKAQPITRLATSSNRGMSYNISECETEGGSVLFGGGVPNDTVTLAPGGLHYFGANFCTLANPLSALGVGLRTFTSVNNIYYMAPGVTRDFTGFGGNSGFRIVAEDFEALAGLSWNDTFIFAADRPTNNFVLTEPTSVTFGGLVNKYGEATVATAGPAVVVPVNVPSIPGKPTYSWRIWRRAAGQPESAATASASVTIQDTVYTYVTNGGVSPANASTLTVTLLSGEFAAGDIISITREQTSGSPTEGEEEDVGGGGDATDLFFLNNRTEPLIMPPAELRNAAIIVDGSWNSFQIVKGTAFDPSGLTSAALGPLAATTYQPQTGSSLLSGGVNGPFFDWTGVQRTDTDALGAIDPASNVALIAPLPEAPVGVSLALPTTIAEGATITTADITVTIPTPGVPALEAGDVPLSLRLVRGGVTTTPASITAATDDLITGVGRLSHPTLIAKDIESAPRVVQASSFAPVVISASSGNLRATGSVSGLEPRYVYAVRFRYATAFVAANTTIVDFGNPNVRAPVGGNHILRVGGSNVITWTPSAFDAWQSVVVCVDPDIADKTTLWLKNGDAAWAAPVTSTTSLGTLFSSGPNTLITGGAGLYVQNQIGLWNATDVTAARDATFYTNFFNSDGTVKNWAADTSLGIGLSPYVLLAGLTQMNNPAANNLGTLPEGIGLDHTGAFTLVS